MSVFSTFGLGKKQGGYDSHSRVGGTGDFLGKNHMSLGKPAAYGMNGTGRDTYIAVDNGGYTKAYEPAFTPETGVFGSRRY